MNEEKKVRPFVAVRPRTGKGWTICIAMIVSILITVSPCIHLWNKPVLFLGLPLMFWCGIFALVATLVIINIAYRWRVY